MQALERLLPHVVVPSACASNVPAVTEPLHTIRFRSGGMEFELISTAEEVAKAREALEPLLLAGLDVGEVDELGGESPAGDGATTRKRTPKRPAKRKRRSTASEVTGDARGEIRSRLLDAPLEGFPEIGQKPVSMYAAYAVLSWAHSKLGIDGLTAQEIQEFMREKWRLGRSYQAYSKPMNGRLRTGEVHASGDAPRVYRLMGPGETALKKWLAEQAKKPAES
jgi:hypothetical protein